MSNAIWTGLTSSGKSLSDAKSSTLRPLPTVIFCMASSPPRKRADLARQVRLRIHERRHVAVVDLRRGLAPRASAQIRRSRFAGQNVEDRKLALKDIVVGRQHVLLGCLGCHVVVDVARIVANERQERAIAVRRVAVRCAVSLEPVEVLVRHRFAQSLQVRFLIRPGGSPNSARSMTSLIRRFPSLFRWMPWIVNGALCSA